jgi:hypothetical protein
LAWLLKKEQSIQLEKISRKDISCRNEKQCTSPDPERLRKDALMVQ